MLIIHFYCTINLRAVRNKYESLRGESEVGTVACSWTAESELQLQ